MREIERDMPRLVKDLRQRVEVDLERVTAQVEERERRVDAVVAGLSERSREFETEVQDRLSAQRRHFERTLRDTAGELRLETREQLADQEHVLRGEIETERRRRREELQQVSTRMDALEQREEQAAAAARALLSDGQAIHDVIRDELPHEQLAPGELARLQRRLDAAEESLAQGSSQAARATSQEAYFSLSPSSCASSSCCATASGAPSCSPPAAR